jgi:hypothetical protein
VLSPSPKKPEKSLKRTERGQEESVQQAPKRVQKEKPVKEKRKRKKTEVEKMANLQVTQRDIFLC